MKITMNIQDIHYGELFPCWFRKIKKKYWHMPPSFSRSSGSA